MSSKFSDDEVAIRPATREDMQAVAAMIQELADFEKMPDGPKLTAKDLVRDGFETSPARFQCVVAVPAGQPPAGYALYFPTYSTWEGPALQLEDLYVRPALRRRHLGRRLLAAVAQEAVRQGCCRVDFHVLEWNEARAFYTRCGAADLSAGEGWRLYRLSGASLRAAAGQHQP